MREPPRRRSRRLFFRNFINHIRQIVQRVQHLLHIRILVTADRIRPRHRNRVLPSRPGRIPVIHSFHVFRPRERVPVRTSPPPPQLVHLNQPPHTRSPFLLH